MKKNLGCLGCIINLDFGKEKVLFFSDMRKMEEIEKTLVNTLDRLKFDDINEESVGIRRDVLPCPDSKDTDCLTLVNNCANTPVTVSMFGETFIVGVCQVLAIRHTCLIEDVYPGSLAEAGIVLDWGIPTIRIVV